MLFFEFQILQLTAIPQQYYNFSLANWRGNKDWLNITNKYGIVFIRDPQLMTSKPTEHRKIMWWKRNATHEISGTSKLIINIHEGINRILFCFPSKSIDFSFKQKSIFFSILRNSLFFFKVTIFPEYLDFFCII